VIVNNLKVTGSFVDYQDEGSSTSNEH
jgi:hypothetical protein